MVNFPLTVTVRSPPLMTSTLTPPLMVKLAQEVTVILCLMSAGTERLQVGVQLQVGPVLDVVDQIEEFDHSPLAMV